jgi:hypothetical protein
LDGSAQQETNGASPSLLSQCETARRSVACKAAIPGPACWEGSLQSEIAPAGTAGTDHEGPHVPIVAVILSLPVLLAVGLLCFLARPGLLVSLLALGLTPVFVFSTTLGAFVLRNRLRPHR